MNIRVRSKVLALAATLFAAGVAFMPMSPADAAAARAQGCTFDGVRYDEGEKIKAGNHRVLTCKRNVLTGAFYWAGKASGKGRVKGASAGLR
ncbi:hypothetical protein [Nonomuraea sp. bgisy101]|uniref:hypothetical protein n=1 Tax=Nonomuraea sp. bgisy101 TaxID=3413784 RepID=UPI003D72C96C